MSYKKLSYWIPFSNPQTLPKGFTPWNPTTTQHVMPMPTESNDLTSEKQLEIQEAKTKKALTNRSKSITVRFNNEELERIEVEAEKKKLNKSNYIRYLVSQSLHLDQPIQKTEDTQLFKRSQRTFKKPSYVDPLLLRHVAQMGNNLNQIAKALNTANLNGQTLELLELIHVLKQMDNHLKDLVGKGVKDADQVS